jgi:DNA polymerase-3 subunit beta
MLAGICLTNRDTDIVFASTDSFRLSEYTIKNVPSNSTPIQIIVPKKTAAEISKMVGDTDGTIDMSMHENQLLVTI